MKINQLESLRILQTVVEKGNFSRAAEHLGLTPAWIAKAIDRLESELATALFIRTTRSVRVTEQGQRCYSHACDMLSQWDAMLESLEQDKGEISGRLKISIPMSFGLAVMDKVLADFQQRYPAIQLEVTLSDEALDLAEHHFDAVIRLAYSLDESTLLVRSIRTYDMITCAAPHYLNKHGTPATPEDLMNHRILKFQRQADFTRWQFMRDGQETVVTPSGNITANNSKFLLAALRSGLGVARIPAFLIDEDLRNGTLSRLLPDYTSPRLTLSLLRQNSKHMSAKLDAFYNFLTHALSPRISQKI